MAEFTKEEQIQAIYDLKVGHTLGHADIAILKAMARQLLSGLEQEPVAEISQAQEYDLEGNLRHQRDIDYYQDDIDKLPVGTKLYAAPQLLQPAVPEIGEVRVGRLPTMNQDEYPGLGDWWVQLRIGDYSDEVLARVYGATPQEANNRAVALACRAAMLQGAEPVSQPYTLRDGWVAVPVEPTREMRLQIHPIVEATCKDCGRSVTADCEDNVLLSWADMIAAAVPQQEVTTDNTTQQFESLGLIVTSDEQKMEPPRCSKHQKTELQVHPFEWVEFDKQLRQWKGVK